MRLLLIFCFLCLGLGMASPSALAASYHACNAGAASSATPPPALTLTPGSLLINEILVNPSSGWKCEDGTDIATSYPISWIEIYNPTSTRVPLSLLSLANSSSSPDSLSIPIPAGYIDAENFITIFDPHITAAHFDNNIVYLMQNATVIDEADFSSFEPLTAMLPDQSYARIPDGGSRWQIATQPTINSTNTPPVAATPTKTPKPTRTPRPTRTPKPVKQKQPAVKKATPGRSKGGVATPEVKTHQSGTTPPHIAGTQPAWGTLQFPGSDQATATPATFPANTSSPPTQTSDLLRTTLLLGGMFGLLSLLIWCWRRWRHP